jgi:hypothetical protein
MCNCPCTCLPRICNVRLVLGSLDHPYKICAPLQRTLRRLSRAIRGALYMNILSAQSVFSDHTYRSVQFCMAHCVPCSNSCGLAIAKTFIAWRTLHRCTPTSASPRARRDAMRPTRTWASTTRSAHRNASPPAPKQRVLLISLTTTAPILVTTTTDGENHVHLQQPSPSSHCATLPPHQAGPLPSSSRTLLASLSHARAQLQCRIDIGRRRG